MFGTSLTARVIIPLLMSEGFAVKALWGRTQEEAEELAREMNVPFYTNRIDDVLLHQDVDLVCINLPPPLTKQIAVKTLGELHRHAHAHTHTHALSCIHTRMLASTNIHFMHAMTHGYTLANIDTHTQMHHVLCWLVAVSCRF